MTGRTDEQRESFETSKFWLEHVRVYGDVHENWEDRGDGTINRYRDARKKSGEDGQRRLNTLWANTEILTPAIYSQCPTPIIERRFLDRDPVGRVSAQILERATHFELEDNGFHLAMRRVVKDYLLPGRGQLWVRYEPKIGQSTSLPPESPSDVCGDEILDDGEKDSEEEDKLESTHEQLISESVPVDYVYWKDFMVFPARARTWEEVTAVGKRVYKSKDEIEERWGRELADAIQPDSSMEEAAGGTAGNFSAMFDRADAKRVIFEIWDRTTRKVYWVSTGYDYVIEEVDDPLGLGGFFPCPAPLSSVTTNETLVPIPFYIEYQDQAIQIDELTQRIHMLGKCIKAVGTYDGSNRALRRLLEESTENELIPVEDWQRHREKGGVDGAISFLPIREMVEALQVLVELRAKVMEDLDRVTGIADIMRGTGDARETLGGQRLKQNSATTRLDKMRDDVAVFARDTIRIIAEVIAKHFSNDSLIKASGILYEEGIALDDYESMKDLLEPEAPPAAPPAPATPKPPMPQPAGMQQPGQPRMAPPGMQQPGQPAMAPPHPAAPIGMPSPLQPPLQPMGPPLQPMGPPPIQVKLQRIAKAIKILRADIPRGYRIIVETDSTIAGEIVQERADTIQFLTAITKFLEQAQLVGAQSPDMVPLLGKLLQFGVRKFRTGRDVESAIDDFIDRAAQQAKHTAGNPGSRPPSAEQMKVQAGMRKAEAEIDKIKLTGQMQMENDQRAATIQQQQAQRDAMTQQADEQRQTRLAQMKFQFEQQTMQMRMRIEQQRLAMRVQMEQARMQQSAAHEQHRMALERQQREHEHAFSMREMEAKGKENDAARAERAWQRNTAGKEQED